MTKYSRTFRETERLLESYLHVLDVHVGLDDLHVRDDLDDADVHDDLDGADVHDDRDEVDVHNGLDITITVRSRPPVSGDALLERLLNRLLA